MSSGVLVFFAVPAVAAVVALVYGIVWLSTSTSTPRASLAARYPLPVITWIIALPMTVLAGAAAFFGTLFAFDGGATGYVDGFEPGTAQQLVEQFAMPVLGLGGFTLGVLVIVMAHLRPRRGPWPRYAMLGVAAVPIAAVLYGSAMFIRAGDMDSGLLAAGLALGSIANALLARPAQDERQARRDARRTAASAAVTTELPPPPPPPSTAPPPPSL
jgi:hypothetical protein